MTSPSPVITPKRNTPTREEWPFIWAKKFRNDLYSLKKTGLGLTIVIQVFISANLGRHPKKSKKRSYGNILVQLKKTLHVWWGKGKKDRIVMLDDDLAVKINALLRTGCGKKYLFEGYTPGIRLSKRSIQKIYEKNLCKSPNRSQRRNTF